MLVEPIENVSAQAKPSGIGIMAVNGLLPHPYWHLKGRFCAPGNGRNLKRAAALTVKHASVEEKREGDNPFCEPIKILGAGDRKIEGAGNRQVHDHGALKGRHDGLALGPKYAAQRTPPIC